MKSSCINHPTREPLLLIRQWQVEACDGNHCAAALLNYFEYWHNIKLDMQVKARQANEVAEKHGEAGTQDTGLYQFHNMDDLKAGLLGMWGEHSIRAARKLLVSKGYITEHGNPNPRYAFDSTVHYLFHPEKAQEWLSSSRSNEQPSRETAERSRGSAGTSPVVSLEISSEGGQAWQNTESGNYLERKMASRLNLLAVHGERWVQEWPSVAMLKLAWAQATQIAAVEGRRPLDAFVWCLNHERPVTGLAELVAAGSRHVKKSTSKQPELAPMLYEEEVENGDEPA